MITVGLIILSFIFLVSVCTWVLTGESLGKAFLYAIAELVIIMGLALGISVLEQLAIIYNWP